MLLATLTRRRCWSIPTGAFIHSFTDPARAKSPLILAAQIQPCARPLYYYHTRWCDPLTVTTHPLAPLVIHPLGFHAIWAPALNLFVSFSSSAFPLKLFIPT